MGYVEPPWYSRPAQEYLAAAYVSARQFDKAREAYDASLQLRPHNGFALYGIARSFELAGKASAAAKAYGDFQRAWAQADSDLPQIVHLTAWMTAHPGGTEWQSAKQSDHPHH
jgi:Tfp pilus assembly protein PilF